jgi:DNA-binding beta-propeller fold protein YncE
MLRSADVGGRRASVLHLTLLLGSITVLSACGRFQLSGNSAVVSSNGTQGSGSPPTSTPVTPTGAPPTITGQPQGLQVAAGQTASFVVTASGAAPLSYQWKRNDVVINGATSSSYTTSALQLSDSGVKFSVVVYNAAGAVVSSEAVVTVNGQAVAITTQPLSQAVAIGASTTFSVVATGTAPLSYQWSRNGVAIAGATAATYTTAGAAPSDSGAIFSVTINNPVNVPVNSQPAVLDVLHTLTLLAGQLGGIGHTDATGAAASFYNPVAVATDSAGNVYVADQTNQLIRKVTPAGAVTTIAGVAGTIGSADGACAGAMFNDPSGIAVDSAGNIYIADTDNDTVRKISMPACVVSTLAGTAGTAGYADGLGTAAMMAQPQGIAVDTSGTLYIADTNNNVIREITPAGSVSTLAGSVAGPGSADGAGTAASFNVPVALAVDSNTGTLYVAEYLNSIIRKVTSTGVVTTLAGTAGNFGATDGAGAAASFSGPTGLTLDTTASSLYVADPGNRTIRRIVIASATVSTFAGSTGTSGWLDATGSSAQFAYPSAIATDSQGNLYVADADNNMVRKITTPGASVTTLAGSLGGRGYIDATGNAARFDDPHTVVSDAVGNLYVADRGNNVIRKIALGGVVTTLAGDAGVTGANDGSGLVATFNQPSGLALDSHGNLYVADSLNNTIRKITPAGVVSTFAGTAGVTGAADGTAASAQFNTPYGLSIDATDTLYLSDYGNSTIRKITTPDAIVTTIAGTPGTSGYADGTGAAAQFSGPYGIAVNQTTGNIYVADRFNETVRMVTAAGVVTTVAGSPLATDYSDGTGTAAHFHWPAAVAIDQTNGVLYVCDYLHNEIRKIDSGGVVTTVVGTPNAVAVSLGPLPGSLTGPSGVAIVSGAPALQLAITDSIENAVLIATLP